ncbi:MAG: hypothetical protein OEW13_09370, partial [Nitrospira sp.]|nr:hypothetical protein [Nitrospira sp.]
KADASKQKHHDDDDDWGSGSRAINEYLDSLTEDGSSIQKPKNRLFWLSSERREMVKQTGSRPGKRLRDSC